MASLTYDLSPFILTFYYFFIFIPFFFVSFFISFFASFAYLFNIRIRTETKNFHFIFYASFIWINFFFLFFIRQIIIITWKSFSIEFKDLIFSLAFEEHKIHFDFIYLFCSNLLPLHLTFQMLWISLSFIFFHLFTSFLSFVYFKLALFWLKKSLIFVSFYRQFLVNLNFFPQEKQLFFVE